jgi:hypothetical protein
VTVTVAGNTACASKSAQQGDCMPVRNVDTSARLSRFPTQHLHSPWALQNTRLIECFSKSQSHVRCRLHAQSCRGHDASILSRMVVGFASPEAGCLDALLFCVGACIMFSFFLNRHTAHTVISGPGGASREQLYNTLRGSGKKTPENCKGKQASK